MKRPLCKFLHSLKNALTKQYQALFGLENVELEFTPEALKAMAKKALERKTGARGLRSIVEAVLLDTMYDLPSIENLRKVVVDESTIVDNTAPKLEYHLNRKVRLFFPIFSILLDDFQ